MSVNLAKRREDADIMLTNLKAVLGRAQAQLQTHPAMERAKAALDVWDLVVANSQTKLLGNCPEGAVVKTLEIAIEHQGRVLAAIDKAMGVTSPQSTGVVVNDQEIASLLK